ncbi:DUF6036 family nucleotidyltransferase [Fulvimonas soli]|jgi:hypothetical protein|uniref:DUF6036 domain-containing protein n=1 Tax=Fulvimonas soli TaxID=155197 RepID=A0A316HLL2_9GAMM|nr:DUF6036 family nucleotidyltransferase [Fulvimonas soli]PWK80944.1 hypothetical protein C7456_1272 [Fulvimonas soli]TNY25303.1 hypothetical protein BV497_14620 [Fulvimonas soli]
MQPRNNAQREYLAALGEIVQRIAASLGNVAPQALPIRMYIAGGTALHFYTGERVSRDVDAAFSRRIALPENLEVAYRDADGAAQLLYLDRNYNDTLALMHEDAYDDSQPFALPGVDPSVLDVRLLSPLDLAVSKLGRFADQDRDDIAALARHGLIDAASLRQRAEAALTAYVGDTARVQNTIDIACRIIDNTRI